MATNDPRQQPLTEWSPASPPSLMFGVPIDDFTTASIVETIGHLVVDGRRWGRTHQISTVNVDFLVNAIADDTLRQILQDADICIADGMPVVWGSRLAGMPLGERVAGADMVPALAAQSVARGWHMHLFGSAEGTAEAAAALLVERNPGAAITGLSGPFIEDIDAVDDALIDEIAANEADILCVALGNPKQERFISNYRDRLGAPVMIGVGGTLDFLIGDRQRAPQWMQRAGVEWIARAAQEPSRLGRRYAHDARVFLPHLAAYVKRVHQMRNSSSICIRTTSSEVWIGPAPVRHDTLEWSRAVDALRLGAALSIDLASAPALQAPAVAGVVGMVRLARRIGADVRIVPPSAAARESFEALVTCRSLNRADL